MTSKEQFGTKIEKAFTYAEYMGSFEALAAEGKTSGLDQSASRIEYTKLNLHRAKRVEKTTKLSTEMIDAVGRVKRNMIWLILTESWCGDAAHSIPVIEAIVSQSDKLKTLYLLRDENLDLMDQYLSGESRAIPKLIAIDADNHEFLGHWGSRPAAAKIYFESLIANGMEKTAIAELMQRWYNSDKGLSIQEDLTELLLKWDHSIPKGVTV